MWWNTGLLFFHICVISLMHSEVIFMYIYIYIYIYIYVYVYIEILIINVSLLNENWANVAYTHFSQVWWNTCLPFFPYLCTIFEWIPTRKTIFEWTHKVLQSTLTSVLVAFTRASIKQLTLGEQDHRGHRFVWLVQRVLTSSIVVAALFFCQKEIKCNQVRRQEIQWDQAKPSETNEIKWNQLK